MAKIQQTIEAKGKKEQRKLNEANVWLTIELPENSQYFYFKPYILNDSMDKLDFLNQNKKITIQINLKQLS